VQPAPPLLQAGVRTPDIPRTASTNELFLEYFRYGWHTRDLRTRAVPLLLRGDQVVTDQDFVTPDEMKRAPYYNDLVFRLGFQWFAAVGFSAGETLWALSIHRTSRQGPFEADDKRIMGLLPQRLTETASLSNAVGRIALLGMTNALNLVQQPALAVDRLGLVLDTNAAANEYLDDEIRVSDRRLIVRDRNAASDLASLVDHIRCTSADSALSTAPIVVRRSSKASVLIRVLPVDAAARNPFLGARALLTLTELRPKPSPDPAIISHVFGLSPAEAKVASLIMMGIAPDQVARRLGVSRETARNQLKSIFAKTETHRQSELVALLSRL
jgi:DNA-binding CsgD family transcriptional regulator